MVLRHKVVDICLKPSQILQDILMGTSGDTLLEAQDIEEHNKTIRRYREVRTMKWLGSNLRNKEFIVRLLLV